MTTDQLQAEQPQRGIFNFFRRQSTGAKSEILSGLTVALALVPEAIAFALIAGVPVLTGLYAAFVVGLMASIFGGRPGMISGATGAMAIIAASLVKEHGIDYLFPAIVLAGLLQLSVGACKLGKLIRLVPHPVMLGFVNGLAIVICMGQFETFKSKPLSTATIKASGYPPGIFSCSRRWPRSPWQSSCCSPKSPKPCPRPWWPSSPCRWRLFCFQPLIGQRKPWARWPVVAGIAGGFPPLSFSPMAT